MKISLKDIDDSGNDYRFDQTHEELPGLLGDLIDGAANFTLDFNIKPMGNLWTLEGSFKGEYQEQCSKCGWETRLPLVFKLNELLMEKPQGIEADSGANVMSSDSTGPSMTYCEGEEINVGDLLHELVALAIPNYPSCKDTVACSKRQGENKIKTDEHAVEGHPAFSVLGKLKKH